MHANSRSNATWYYARALHEFETAIRQDPGLVEVLDAYGYVVWQWTLDALEQIRSDYPELTEDDIRACLAYAADRERRVSTAAK